MTGAPTSDTSSTPYVWLGDRLVPAEQATISVLDHAFTVGDAVFETMRVDDGVPFALTRHLRRLDHSARGLGLAAPDQQRVREAIDATLSHPGIAPLSRLRVTYGGGVAPMGSGRGATEPVLVVTVAAQTPWQSPTAAVTVPWVRNERSAVTGLKTTSYAENVVALAAAHRAGATEAVLANTRGLLCEGTGSNVFVVKDGAVATPTLDSGCLAGVTRELVLEWCAAEAGLDVRERPVAWDELGSADEVFLTSSTRDVQAVGTLDGRALPGDAGPVTRQVAATFARRADEDVDP